MTTITITTEQLKAIVEFHQNTAERLDADHLIELTDDGTYGLLFRFRVSPQGSDLWKNYKAARVEPGGSVQHRGSQSLKSNAA